MVDLLSKQKQNASGSEPMGLVVMFLVLILTTGLLGFYSQSTKVIAALDVPQLISFQGKLTNQNRITVADGNQNMKFGIYNAASGGTCLWSAKDTDANSATIDCPSDVPGGSITVSVTDGVFYVLLGDTTGSQNALPDNLFDNNSTLYIGVTIGADAEMTPRIRLASAPFSMQSGNADLLDAFNTSQIGSATSVLVSDSSGNLVLTGSLKTAAGQGVTTSGAGALKLGTVTATSIDMGGASVTAINLATDGTGDTEIVLPNGAISTAEILDGTIDGGDLADTITIDGSLLAWTVGASQRFRVNAAANTNNVDGVVDLVIDSLTTQNNGLNLAYTMNATAGNQVQTGARISLTNAGTAVNDTLTGLLMIKQDNASNATSDRFITLQNLETTAGSISDAIFIDASATNADITNGLNASDASITNAVDVGDNIIIGTNAIINFAEFDVSGTTGSVTIDDGGNVGNVSVEGTTLDINSLDFNGPGTINTTAGNLLTLAGNNGVSVTVAGTVPENLLVGTSGSAVALRLNDTAGSAQNTEANSLFYLTQPDASNRYGIYLDTEEATNSQTVMAIETDTTNGSGADTFKFRIDASGEAFSDVGFSSGATTKFTDGIIHKVDPGTFSIFTYGGPGDDILLDDLTLVVDSYDDFVGIGTRSPKANLDIDGANNEEFMRLTASDDEVGVFSGVDVPTFEAEGGSIYMRSDADGTGTPGLYLNTSTTDTGSTWTEMPLSTTTQVTNVTNYSSSGGGSDSDNQDLDNVYEQDDDVTLTLGTSGLIFDTASTDMALAETFVSTTDLEAGTLVQVDSAVAGQVAATTTTYASGLIGVVTDAPALLLSDVSGESVARSGVVSVKVSDENGVIVIGDPLTSSSVSGTAMKATAVGEIVGFALSEFTGPGTGTVTVAVQPHWSAGSVLSTDGTVTAIASNVLFDTTGTADATTTTYDSRALTMRGSAWDGAAAQTVEMTIVTDVTSTDDYRLSIQNTSATEVAYVSDEGDVAIAGRFYPSDRGTLQTAKYIYYDGDEGIGGDVMRTNASGWGTGSYDFAEMFPSSETLSSGDVVVFGTDNESVATSGTTYDLGIAGIVSTRPGFLAGDNLENHFPIALAGRVPTKVSLENGEIEIGDPLTTSSTPGYAMKATESGMIVGYALEPYTGVDSDSDKIIVFVNAGYWGGDSEASERVVETRSSPSNLSTLTMNGNIYLTGNSILGVSSIQGLGNTWEIADDGLVTTTASYDVVIESYQGEDVSAHALTSMEQKITLSGSSALTDGQAAIVFEDIDPLFNDITSTTADIRVLITPRGPSNGLFVSESDHNGFTVEENLAGDSDVEFDWFVEAYRKDYEPAEEEITDTEEIPVTEEITDPDLLPEFVEGTEETDQVEESESVELSTDTEEPVEEISE